MKEYPHSFSFSLFSDDLDFRKVCLLAKAIARISGFSLELKEHNTTHQDVGYHSYNMKTTDVALQQKINEELAVLVQVDTRAQPLTLTVGRQETSIGIRYAIAIGLPKTIEPEIVQQLDDFMMTTIIMVDRLMRAGAHVNASITWHIGDCISASFFSNHARKQFLEIFEPE